VRIGDLSRRLGVSPRRFVSWRTRGSCVRCEVDITLSHVRRRHHRSSRDDAAGADSGLYRERDILMNVFFAASAVRTMVWRARIADAVPMLSSVQ